MTDLEKRFAPFMERMESANLPKIFINSFASYYEQLLLGSTGLIAEAEIEPVTDLPDAAQFSADLSQIGESVLSKTAVIKLNGGLGTSMGLAGAKSLLIVKDDLSFLDIIARQALLIDVPLILMNSFTTHEDSLAVLARYPQLNKTIPQSFLQNKEPKIQQSNLEPIAWPAEPELEWCPPGHGDIYTALVTSGTLTTLLENGYEYAFVSNSDNLGAVVDFGILGYFAQEGLPFMMEVAERTGMDRKGGHLARRLDGQLVLRESAQCPDDDILSFQDISRHKYFNTNNLWLHLSTLAQVMAERDNKLGLPMIRNTKTVDPRDLDSTAVYQLETAMGSAIAVFAGAAAIRVPRNRFAPVKATDDLLAVRSDAYILTDDFRVIPKADRQMRRFNINLDPDYYKFVSDLEERFPDGPPSLAACNQLTIQGDFKFGKDVVCQGDVALVNEQSAQVTIADETVLAG